MILLSIELVSLLRNISLVCSVLLSMVDAYSSYMNTYVHVVSTLLASFDIAFHVIGN